jgi:hypothetical protein
MRSARSADAPTIGAMSWPRLPPAAGPDRRQKSLDKSNRPPNAFVARAADLKDKGCTNAILPYAGFAV